MGKGLPLLAAASMALVWSASSAPRAASPQQTAPAATTPVSPERAVLNRYCTSCHNVRTKTAGLTLDTLDVEHVGEHPETWEQVVKKVRAGVMPPAGRPRPDKDTYDKFARSLE